MSAARRVVGPFAFAGFAMAAVFLTANLPAGHLLVLVVGSALIVAVAVGVVVWGQRRVALVVAARQEQTDDAEVVVSEPVGVRQ